MTRIPLSLARKDTDWPIATFHLMVKPPGPACNIACDYCYYLHKSDKVSLPGLAIMDDELLETSIREYIQSVDDYTVFFSRHGGEPTLAGLNFYRKAFELQKK